MIKHRYEYAMKAYKENHVDPHTVACARYFCIAKRLAKKHRIEWKLHIHYAMYSFRVKTLSAKMEMGATHGTQV